MTVARALSAVTLAATCMTGPGCGGGSATPTTPTPPPAPTATLTATFDQNPVPFRPTGCSFSTPAGWYAAARVQETAGVAFTVTTLTQKLDGATAGFLAESFNSRFGACSGMPFTPGMILANGAACATVGACTAGSHSTYQFSLAGTDANGHSITFDSPVLQLGARPAGQMTPYTAPSFPTAPEPRLSSY
jgi:hypothetical protein